MTSKLAAAAVLAASMGAAIGWMSATTAQQPAEIDIQPLFSDLPGDLGGKRMTVVEVTYPPGVAFPAHRHSGSVFAYVLEGTIRSQLGTDSEPVTYSAGDSWYEPPDARHVFSENPSTTDPVRLLAVLIGDDGAELVLPDDQ